jgi:hypothetical protein
MAIGAGLQQIATTLAVLKADTSQYREEMRRVTGAEREAVKAQLAAAEARNKSLQKWAEGLTKINVVLSAVTKAIQAGAEAYKVYEKHATLAIASNKYSLEALRVASKGLRTDMELLTLAAKAQNTTFKLGQGELELALQAMQAFERQGQDSAKVFEVVGKAITEGTVEPLKEFGVVVEGAKTPAEKYRQLMNELRKVAHGVAGAQDTATESFRKQGVEYRNAMDQINIAIGKMVVSLGPLISNLASVASVVGDIISAIPEGMLGALAAGGAAAYGARRFGIAKSMGGAGWAGAAIAGGTYLGEFVGGGIAGYLYDDEINANKKRYAEAVAKRADIEEKMAVTQASIEAQFEAAVLKSAMIDVKILKADIALMEKTLQLNGVKVGKQKPGRPAPKSIEMEAEDSPQAMLRNAMERHQWNEAMRAVDAVIARGTRGPTDVALEGTRKIFGGTVEENRKWAAEQDRLREMRAGLDRQAEKESIVESIFGPLDEYDLYAEKMQTLGDAVGAFSGALTAGFDAWVSGSKSASEAIKGLFGDTVNALARSMFAHAIEHGAAAIGSLAIQDYRGAALHGKAAAAYAAGAITVGAIARQLNKDGGGAGVGAGAPSVIGPASGGSGERGSNTTIIIGDSLADDSPRWRQKRVNDMLRRARRGSTEDGSVQYR